MQSTGVFMADQAENVTIEVSVDGEPAVRHKGPTTPLNEAAFVDFVNDGRAFVSVLAVALIRPRNSRGPIAVALVFSPGEAPAPSGWTVVVSW